MYLPILSLSDETSHAYTAPSVISLEKCVHFTRTRSYESLRAAVTRLAMLDLRQLNRHADRLAFYANVLQLLLLHSLCFAAKV